MQYLFTFMHINITSPKAYNIYICIHMENCQNIGFLAERYARWGSMTADGLDGRTDHTRTHAHEILVQNKLARTRNRYNDNI